MAAGTESKPERIPPFEPPSTASGLFDAAEFDAPVPGVVDPGLIAVVGVRVVPCGACEPAPPAPPPIVTPPLPGVVPSAPGIVPLDPPGSVPGVPPTGSPPPRIPPTVPPV